MAAHRLLGREVATSLRLNELPERTELAYLKAIPFTDRDGRLPGEARKLRALCYPMRDWTAADVQKMTKELEGAGLWLAYQDDEGRHAIQVLKHHDHQPGVRPGSARYNGERPSVFGPPPDAPDASATRNQRKSATGARANVKEGNGTKRVVAPGAGRETARDPPEDPEEQPSGEPQGGNPALVCVDRGESDRGSDPPVTPLAGVVNSVLGGLRSPSETSASTPLESGAEAGFQGPDTAGALAAVGEGRRIDPERLAAGVGRLAGLPAWDPRVERLVHEYTQDVAAAVALDDLVQRLLREREGGKTKDLPLTYLRRTVPMRRAELRASAVERELEEHQSRKPLRHRQYNPQE